MKYVCNNTFQVWQILNRQKYNIKCGAVQFKRLKVTLCLFGCFGHFEDQRGWVRYIIGSIKIFLQRWICQASFISGEILNHRECQFWVNFQLAKYFGNSCYITALEQTLLQIISKSSKIQQVIENVSKLASSPTFVSSGQSRLCSVLASSAACWGLWQRA